MLDRLRWKTAASQTTSGISHNAASTSLAKKGIADTESGTDADKGQRTKDKGPIVVPVIHLRDRQQSDKKNQTGLQPSI
ncbi:hypothetical protein [Leptospira adleri]|uniref:hypothetical protein n=1 Tax=Leptospira adleri TaxID=2023186 RepID=UPI001FD3BB3B|nr:hypothetical protein [Leptospira adleri]